LKGIAAVQTEGSRLKQVTRELRGFREATPLDRIPISPAPVQTKLVPDQPFDSLNRICPERLPITLPSCQLNLHRHQLGSTINIDCPVHSMKNLSPLAGTLPPPDCPNGEKTIGCVLDSLPIHPDESAVIL